ncbi:MAG: OmcA/MtrC family decaheme c-type cytochrome [Burkholderiales bacterium]|nr:OmcA/MtrC family decaheme c-type cytochrome [Burkholderiales bacterium]
MRWWRRVRARSAGSTGCSRHSAIAAASALAANDTASNAAAPFTVLQSAGIAAVVVNGAPKVNFAVFSNGAVKADLKIADVSFAIAKLVPGSNGNPDQWVNYIYRKETAATGVGPGGKPALASAMQATTDAKQTDAALLAAQLVYNADGYYTYTFKTNIQDPAQTNGVVFEPARTHRVAIQLSYKNAAGQAVLVNPYIDFTVDAAGKSVLVTDPAKTRKMTDVSSCNSCHEKLGLHGGGRVDTQYCVLCHNPGTVDANSGNNLNLSTMVHKIHAGKRLNSAGEDYTIWGYQNSKHSYAEVGFPQDLRNCSKCHSAANASTPQGDNWKSKPSKEACLSCHVSALGSAWETLHKVVAVQYAGAGTPASALPNQECVRCHGAGSVVSAENVHFNQVEVNAAKYKMNIESVAFNDTADHKGRSVTVKYFLSDPTKGDAAYNLVTPDCTSTPSLSCANTTKFGNLRFYLAYQNMVGQYAAVTEYSAYNNGGSAANAYAYKGTNDGKNHYTLSVPLPDDTATAVATGTARVVSIGQVKEAKLAATSGVNPRPEVSPGVQVNILVQHTSSELALSGALQARRTIVSNDKCNACHSNLGAASGSNTLANAFHSGGRDTVEACILCHDANRVSSTVMTNGMALNESYQFKRMIHGIHGNSKRTYPFTIGNLTQGVFNKLTGAPVAPWTIPMKDSYGRAIGTSGPGQAGVVGLSSVENFAAEVAWPGVGINCNACHVNDSYKIDLSPLGAVVKKDAGVTDPNLWKVISPKAASCTACHDSPAATDHVASFGGAFFGSQTQAQIAGSPRETCNDCHASGGAKSVDLVHGQK